jgi:membrane glycosyltransferase
MTTLDTQRQPRTTHSPPPQRLAKAALRRYTHAAAPTVQRSSMLAQPWHGFLRGLRDAIAGRRSAQPDRLAQAPWRQAAARRRNALLALVLLAALTAALTAAGLMALAQPDALQTPARIAQLGLFALLFAWVSAGFVTAVMGWRVLRRGDAHMLSHASVARRPISGDARTAVIMPICNEHVPTVFAGLAATADSLVAAGGARLAEIYVLSDSSDPALRAAERQAWAALQARCAVHGLRVHYRWRLRRTRRKAGNVADFCRRWGALHRYMVVLDADSVMSGEAILGLVRLMEAHPQAGILQSAPVACGVDTPHARAQQFAGRVTGRLFSAGMQYWQLGESHYWGHNAIIRIAPFMAHCALAPVPGQGGLAGDILSHDFVEAALMRRGGWQVWLVPDLPGSWEQQPPHVLAELQRDRRWCQGNLQNARLIAEPGLHRVHRAMLATGALSYLSAPLWLASVLLGAVLWFGGDAAGGQTSLLQQPTGAMLALWGATLTMLLLPRALGVALVLRQQQQQLYGGTRGLVVSALLEALLSSLLAPLRMAAHTLFVAAALTGLDLHWTSPPRQAEALRWRDAAGPLLPLALAAAAVLGASLLWAPGLAIWLAPMALPLLLALPLVVASADPRLGLALKRAGLLLTPEETAPSPVLQSAWAGAQAVPPAALPNIGAAVLPMRRLVRATPQTAKAG